MTLIAYGLTIATFTWLGAFLHREATRKPTTHLEDDLDAEYRVLCEVETIKQRRRAIDERIIRAADDFHEGR